MNLKDDGNSNSRSSARSRSGSTAEVSSGSDRPLHEAPARVLPSEERASGGPQGPIERSERQEPSTGPVRKRIWSRPPTAVEPSTAATGPLDWDRSAAGNPTVTLGRFRATVFRDRIDPTSWCFVIGDRDGRPQYGPKFSTPELAREAAAKELLKRVGSR